MRRILTILIILAIVSSAIIYIFYKFYYPSLDKIISTLKVSKLSQEVRGVLDKQISSSTPTEDKTPVKKIRRSSAKEDTQSVTENTVTLYLKNGTTISGELLKKIGDEYYIKWKGGTVTFHANEIERVVRGVRLKEKEGLLFDEEVPKEWPYENDIVIRLTNGAVLDGKIIRVDKEKVSIGYPVEGGGSIEQDIKRTKIEYLTFKPIDDDESKKKERDLKELFPNMKFYKEGNFTIVTDSYITWVKKFKTTLRQTYTDIYLDFFKLLRNRKPKFQNFVVIFDDYEGFVEYAVTDGVPGWAVLGYFEPEDKTLYLFNSLGDKFADIIFEVMVGVNVKLIDAQVDEIKKYVGNKYDLALEGLADEAKDKFWRYYNIVKGEFRRETTSTLRHEFTHEVFANWGLQNIVVSRTKRDDEELIKKKKDFFETEDLAKKKQMLLELITLKRGEEPLDLQAANSWLAEGTATYFETDPPGSKNERWLFVFQDMMRKKGIYPLEQLTVYKIGSFPGVYPAAMLDAYAQSWAFVTFLIDRYPDEFMEYQDRIAKQPAQKQKDIEWLIESIGKDLRELEKEFAGYMDRYEGLEDPFVKRFEKLYNIFQEFK